MLKSSTCLASNCDPKELQRESEHGKQVWKPGDVSMLSKWQEHWKSHWYLYIFVTWVTHGEIDFYNIAHLLELNSSSSKIQQSQSSNLLLPGFCRRIIPWQCLLILWYDDMKNICHGCMIPWHWTCKLFVWSLYVYRFEVLDNLAVKVKVFVLRNWP